MISSLIKVDEVSTLIKNDEMSSLIKRYASNAIIVDASSLISDDSSSMNKG